MIQKIFDPEVQEFWIVFTQGTHFISHLLKKNFSHVYLITRDKYNWIILNPLRLHLGFEIPAAHVNFDLPRDMRQSFDNVIKITMYKRDSKKQFAHFGLLNCVTYVKYILGLRMYVLTPFRLYKRLLHLSESEKIKHGIQSIKLIA